MSKYGLIGGTGLSQLPGFSLIREHDVATPYGRLCQPVSEGYLVDCVLMFLPRHGKHGSIPPHKINYRANLAALKQMGVEQVIAINAVGCINPAMKPADIVLPDQIVDYTWGREHTLYDGLDRVDSLALEHVDMTQPYDEALRLGLIGAANTLGLEFSAAGTYAATQGPRLETAAEIVKLAGEGCDIVGMTGMPEASLARELGLAYASICIVVNRAAGLSQEPITMSLIEANLGAGIDSLRELLVAFLGSSPDG
jgi:5'-methylthioinosine phosphorylase